MRLALPTAVGLWLALAARPAIAQDGELMAKAKAAMAQLDFDTAIKHLEQAEATGRNGPAEMVEIYRAVAESHAAMGRADAAETAFRRLLALDPSVELPPGSSPKLTAPFAGAREFLAGRRIAVECRRSGAEVATLVVQSDPVDLVAGARLTTAAGEAVGEDARGQARIALAIPGGAAAAGCAALDRQGNVLARAEMAEAAAGAGGDETAAAGTGPVVSRGPAERGDRPLYARWWLYAGLAGAAGGVALYYGLRLKSAEDDLEALQREMMQMDHDVTYPDFLAIEDRGESAARNANIALVVTGVFAAVSGGLLIHQVVTDRGEVDEEQGPAVSAGPLPGGAAVNLTLGF